MDPLTQGVVGALAAGSVARRAELRTAAGLGFVAGTLADLDVLIRSDADPLLHLDFHRQFTHSLAFVPVAALVIAAVAARLLRVRGGEPPGFPRLFVLAAIGYGSHGLLDACTTYGTSLLWPFSDVRIAWNVVAVVDPGLTVPALALTLLATRRRSPQIGRVALAWVLVWLTLGLVQRERARDLLERTAAEQGLAPTRSEVKPTLLNLVLWRGMAEVGGEVHAIALRPGLLGPGRVSEWASRPGFRIDRDLPWLSPTSIGARDVERFRRFSDGWLVASEGERSPPDSGAVLVGDARYAMLPDRIDPLWAIRVDPARPDAHVEFVTRRDARPEVLARFREMLWGRGLERRTGSGPSSPGDG